MEIKPDLEEELMERFRSGDTRAFRAIFDRFYQELCIFSYRLTRSKEQGEEIVSESMNKLFQRHANFSSVANVKAFLYITSRNLSLNFLSSKEYKTKQKNQSIESIPEKGDENVLTNILKIDLFKRLHQHVESLPQKQKEIFKLFFFDDLSLEEIASHLELSPATVRSHKFHALQKLKVLFPKSEIINVSILLPILAIS